MRLLANMTSTLGRCVAPVLCVVGLALTGAACGDDEGEDKPGNTDGPSSEPQWDPTAPQLDLSCVDGKVQEAIPLDIPDLSALIASYDSANYQAFIDDVLAQTYTLGGYLVDEGLRLGTSVGHCVDDFLSATQRSTPQRVIRQMSTLVHECGHYLDLSYNEMGRSTYVVTEELRFECTRGDTTTRGGDTFARSRINNDIYAALNPDDFYKDVYLNGNPDDRVFESGDQGFNMLLEEAFQYVNSLATDFYLRDQFRGISISARDGILTFLWYVQRYLRMARLEYPQAYERLSGDACWRESILTMWGRAWRYLEVSDPSRHPSGNLGIDDKMLKDLVLDPDLLDEIERLRAAHGCRG